MSSQPLAILSTGLVTAVGLTAAASCAAIRAKLSNPTESRFIDSSGEWITTHSVPLEQPWVGVKKLVRMAAHAIDDCLSDIPRNTWREIPLLLCVAELDRPGRVDGIDDELFGAIQRELEIEFSEQSLIIPHGRVSISNALAHARRLLVECPSPFALIVSADSLLNWSTLSFYHRAERLLTQKNSNGFIPGEGASALLVGHVGNGPQLVCTGLGFSTESAAIDSEQPLRGDGLARAIKAALAEAGCAIHDMDFRIADLSGEQFYLKEAALSVARILRVRKEHFDIWHPAECIGECGAMIGPAAIAVAYSACHKGYAPGRNILFHAAADGGARAAAVFRYGFH